MDVFAMKERGSATLSVAKRLALPSMLTVFAACSSPDAMPDTDAAEGELRSINGTDLYVSEFGDGDPLLVIHGGPGMESSYLFPGLDVLEPDARLVVFDQRGTGRSADAALESVSLDAFLEDIDGVRASVQAEKIDVLAHSWGGLLGLLYAARYPDRVRSLVLVSTVEPGQRFAARAAQRQAQARTPEDAALIDSLSQSPGVAAFEAEAISALYWAALRPTFGDRSAADKLKVEFTDRTARSGSDVARALMTPLGAFDFWAEAGTITAPTLIVHGAADPTPVEMADALAATIAGAQIHVIDDAGHFPFLERPIEFRTTVSTFLNTLPES